MTEHSISSGLQHSERLGRTIRAGNAQSLGVPTENLVIAALADGDLDATREYFAYAVDEASRVHAVLGTWIGALLGYGHANVHDFEAMVQRLTDVIGARPPLDEAADRVSRTGIDFANATLALESGDHPKFLATFRSLLEEAIVVHDAQSDWVWGLLSSLRDALGESRMDEVFRVTLGSWVTARYATLGEMTPQESLELTIEGMRGHFVSSLRDGHVDIDEKSDRWILSFDPCGTGGRMRRNDPARGYKARTESPFSFAVTEQAHDWSWNEKGVCLYCAHCSFVNEILPIEAHGAPMRVTEYPKDPGDSCRWTIYKSADLVPDWVYERIGKEPPTRT